MRPSGACFALRFNRFSLIVERVLWQGSAAFDDARVLEEAEKMLTKLGIRLHSFDDLHSFERFGKAAIHACTHAGTPGSTDCAIGIEEFQNTSGTVTKCGCKHVT